MMASVNHIKCFKYVLQSSCTFTNSIKYLNTKVNLNYTEISTSSKTLRLGYENQVS